MDSLTGHINVSKYSMIHSDLIKCTLLFIYKKMYFIIWALNNLYYSKACVYINISLFLIIKFFQLINLCLLKNIINLIIHIKYVNYILKIFFTYFSIHLIIFY